MLQGHHSHRSLPAITHLQLQQKGQDPAVPTQRSSPKKSFINAHRENSKEIDPIWEGSYKINTVGSKGSYTLTTINDKEIEKQWNAYNLRKYHA
ncbi:hypothetical protein ACFX1X_003039 [Malus domestica]